jgi:hypothetical protein
MLNCRFCAFQEALMILRDIFIAVFGVTLLWSGVSIADEYRPDEFLGLDLSRAVLSPRPLGPAAGFAPGPLDVKVDRGGEDAQARAEPAAEPKIVVRNARVAQPRAEQPRVALPRVVHQRVEPPRLVARTKLARHHRSPLDAQAFDARVQVWPCKSGGICNWKR